MPLKKTATKYFATALTINLYLLISPTKALFAFSTFKKLKRIVTPMHKIIGAHRYKKFNIDIQDAG